ncbi:glycosyltransferase family 4 protein [Vibrio cyclitrophicus]
MKRIILFHQGADEYGSDKIFYLVVKRLAKENKVKVVLDCAGPLVDKLTKVGVVDVEILDLSVLRKVNIKSMHSFILFSFSMIKSIYHIRKLLNDFDPDILYVNTLAVISPLLASCGLRCTVIHHLHEIQYRPKFIFCSLYSISGLFSDNVLCVSKSVVACFNELSIFGKDKTRLLYNGLDEEPIIADDVFIDEVDSKFNNKGPIIAYVARIHVWKGQLEFLDVVDYLVNKKGLSVNFAFFGDVFPGYEILVDKINSRIVELNIENNVHFFGFRRDASELFALADVSVMGSIEPDPLPTIVLESMAQSTPVVAYAHGGSTEMIENGKTGYLVEPLNVELMAASLEALLSDNILRHKMGAESRLRFENRFSLDSFYSKLEKVLGL